MRDGWAMMVSRFFERIEKVANGCWLWTGAKTVKGYGTVVVKGKRIKAHRWAWFIQHGMMPTACVLHRCDTRACVRPDHLFLGTVQDNNADCIAKGRHAHAKLTADQVHAIRVYRAEGYTQKSVALGFGIDRTTVRAIERREIWRQVP